MARFRSGDPVAVNPGFNRPERHGTVFSSGQDSGGPYVIVDLNGGAREMFHPDRVRVLNLSQQCRIHGLHGNRCPGETTLGTAACECSCHTTGTR